MLGRLISLCAYCRHLCRYSSPALPKCSTRHNGCYVLQQICLWVSQIRICIRTNANTGLITSVQLIQLINTANWLSIVSHKTLCGDKKCPRRTVGNKCPVQRKCMQNGIGIRQIFGSKATKVFYFLSKRNSGKTLWGPKLVYLNVLIYKGGVKLNLMQ